MPTSLAVAGVVLLLAAAPAGAVTITDFPVGAGPRCIHPGPDGNIWFAYSAGIGRISPAGERFAPILDTHYPVDLVTAANGFVYWSGDTALGLRTDIGSVTNGRTTAPAYAIALTASGELPARFRARTGSTLTFSLWEAAEVMIAVARRRAGRGVGGVCRPPSLARGPGARATSPCAHCGAGPARGRTRSPSPAA